VTCPVIGFTVMIRELLFGGAPPWVDWLESVAKNRPPERPLTNPMSIAGPAGWNPTAAGGGLAQGTPDQFPVSIEDQDVWCERVGRAESTANNGVILLVAPTTPQSVTGF